MECGRIIFDSWKCLKAVRSHPMHGRLDLVLKTYGLESITIVLYLLSNWHGVEKTVEMQIIDAKGQCRNTLQVVVLGCALATPTSALLIPCVLVGGLNSAAFLS